MNSEDGESSFNDVPTWARFFEPDQLAEFVGIIRNTLVDLHVEHELHVRKGLVELRPDGSTPRLLGLGNLAQICRQLARDDWPDALALQLGHLLRLPDEDGELLDRFGDDFQEAREYLKVRLFGGGLPNEDSLVFRRPMEGVMSVLVYDLPDAIATVPREHVTNWCRFDDELFEIAMAHVRDDRPDREDVELDDGVQATILASESFFSATHALLLDDYLDSDASRGALVAIPHRHVVLLHEIRDENVIPALERLVHLALAMHDDGPGSISSSVYWYDRRRFHRIPASMSDDSIQIFPPPAFVEMLNGLHD